ncbi:exodeoxyribonuclease VII small subunit [Halobacteriovorax sp. HLS]|uniref:exodeoxyribonuclease VII small subunit n=1 Tax=Halobacteriovorax sp. HLS TaxID=2234000 RepID=UPI000FD6D0E4|nr:exodeoxyribonuclease VII small subunit [Halobacteriovorax sp. HLS]
MVKEKKSFEQSLDDLEQLVSSLEHGELGLDDSIEKFEEGVKLYKFCKDQLGKAEKKITKLTESLNEVNLEE